MLSLNGRNLLLGGFHDHWSRADGQNPAVLLAALNYYHYDFMTLMCGSGSDAVHQEIARIFSDKIRLYSGREQAFGWAHVVTVGPKAPPLTPSDPDYRSCLRKLKATCDLVILGHPTYIAWEPLMQTGEVDKLLEEGLLDGVQLTTDYFHQPGSRDNQQLDWLRAREARGLKTPIVGGWDVHLMKAIRGLPDVLYSTQFIPDGHFEAPCSTRTIVFAQENSLPAICAAVKAGQTVLEQMPSGKLIGPADLVGFLQDSGYHKAIADLDRRRDAVTLSVPEPLIANSPATLKVSQPGQLRLPLSLREYRTLDVKADQPVTWDKVPVLLERDHAYQPIAWNGADGAERIWAVRSTHPVQLDILPAFGKNNEPEIEIVDLRPFDGQIELKLEGTPPSRQPIRGRTRLPAPASTAAGTIAPYELKAQDSAGLTRSFSGHLTWFAAQPFCGDWSAMKQYGVDQPLFAPVSAYGKGRPWPGPETYSARLQFGWSPEAFHLRATVRDAVHYQPFHGHYAYNADCLQLALDPMLRRTETLGNVYAFNLALTPNGPELYRTWAPDAEATSTFTPPPPDVSLADRYLHITPWEGGLVYELKLPWSQLAPVRPQAGHRMGIYYIMFNNDGTGHLDTLHWPVPIFGMWTRPNKWGVLTLLSE